MKKIINSFLIAGLFFTACKKDITAETPTATINPLNARSVIGDTLVFKLGDTCKFQIDGIADNISFWAGTVGNKYENKDRSSGLGAINLSFTSTAAFGAQTNTLQVLATNKLTGRDSATVVNASWINITNRALLATSATAVNSGTINLSDLVTGTKDSLFIAFKYSGVTGSTQRTWVISNLLVNNTFTDYAYNLLSNSADANYWTRYGNVWNPASARWVSNTTSLTIVGGGGTAPTNNSIIVSKAMYVGRVAPDVPSGNIKNITSSAVPMYNYKYPAIGKYKATFANFAVTPNDSKLNLIEFNIKIIP